MLDLFILGSNIWGIMDIQCSVGLAQASATYATWLWSHCISLHFDQRGAKTTKKTAMIGWWSHGTEIAMLCPGHKKKYHHFRWFWRPVNVSKNDGQHFYWEKLIISQFSIVVSLKLPEGKLQAKVAKYLEWWELDRDTYPHIDCLSTRTESAFVWT